MAFNYSKKATPEAGVSNVSWLWLSLFAGAILN